jgi:hypothetical protein
VSQEELITAFDRAKASFNSQQDRSGYLNLYDSSFIAHGFPPNLPGNFEGLKMFYNALLAAFPDSHLEFHDIVFKVTSSQRDLLFLELKKES